MEEGGTDWPDLFRLNEIDGVDLQRDESDRHGHQVPEQRSAAWYPTEVHPNARRAVLN
jgi:hypothetical protein